MKFQKDDFVKLSTMFLARPDTNCDPLWGGREGYIGGVVKAVHTHAHESKDHKVVVEWFNGKGGEYKEIDLAYMTVAETDYSKYWLKCNGNPPNDIFILLKTGKGKYILNIIEAISSHCDTPKVLGEKRFTTMITHHQLPSVDSLDAVVVAKAMSFPDVKETSSTTLAGARSTWFHDWNITMPRSVYHPLKTYKSVAEAAAASPKEVKAGAYVFFHLLDNLCDLSVTS